MCAKFTRPTSKYLENILGEEFNVLDNGFVSVCDFMGNDDSVVRAARVSFKQETSKNPKGLLDYLVRHMHTTPIEACEIVFHVKLPIFVARQWMRHRASTFNEVSGRYVELSEEFFIPEHYHLKAVSNKQGRSEVKFDDFTNDVFRNAAGSNCAEAFSIYHDMLENGVAPEQAREHLPLNTYTEFVWKIDLHNLLHFLKLRTDSHAQFEIREYARVIEDIVAGWVPLIHQAWVNYRKESVVFSKRAMENVRQLVTSAYINEVSWEGVSDREKREVLQALGLERS